MVESWTRDQKAVGLILPALAVGDFSSPRSTFCADSYFGGQSPPSVFAVAHKNPGDSDKSAGVRLQLNTHAPYVCVALNKTVNWCMLYTE